MNHTLQNKVGVILNYKRSVYLTNGVQQPRSCLVMDFLLSSLSKQHDLNVYVQLALIAWVISIDSIPTIQTTIQ